MNTADQFTAQLEEFGKNLEDQVLATTREKAEAIKKSAAARTPVRSGRLRAGWQVVRTGPDAFRVENDVPYAETIELGTQRRPGAHMLGLAIADARNL